MQKFIFVGPTLSFGEIKDLSLSSPVRTLEDVTAIPSNSLERDALVVMPPVAGGDLQVFESYDQEFLIALIDGYFENRTAVWHKEILSLLAQDVPMFGAASMGALRAAELTSYGMRGVGSIYRSFYHGILEDDDEVTVAHGPAKLGYPQISEAMINIRATINAARDASALEDRPAEAMKAVAKETFYKLRNYGYLIRRCIDELGFSERDFSDFHNWLQTSRIDQKKIDAIDLILTIDTAQFAELTTDHIKFEFEDSWIWRNSIREVS